MFFLVGQCYRQSLKHHLNDINWNMEDTIDVENYENNGQCIVDGNIDHVLHRNGLFRLDAFTYSPGIVCLMHYTSFYISATLRLNLKWINRSFLGLFAQWR
jgi:hypothetical protein